MGGCLGLICILAPIILATLIFPLPLNDGRKRMRYESIPWVTIGLILINCAVFLAWLAPMLYRNLNYTSVQAYVRSLYPYIEAVWTYGFRGTYLREGQSIGAFVTFSSIFMHADMGHLAGNMAYLWTFGHRLEDSCGHWRFLAFYLASGMIANMGSYLINPSSDDIPSIGASGAIAGIMGAYLLLFFDTQIGCLWLGGSILRLPYGLFTKHPIWRWTIPVPAWVLLIFFAVYNTVFSLISLQEGQSAGVNYLAHFMGFVAGILIFFYLRKDIVTRYVTGRAL